MANVYFICVSLVAVLVLRNKERLWSGFMNILCLRCSQEVLSVPERKKVSNKNKSLFSAELSLINVLMFLCDAVVLENPDHSFIAASEPTFFRKARSSPGNKTDEIIPTKTAFCCIWRLFGPGPQRGRTRQNGSTSKNGGGGSYLNGWVNSST